MLTEVRWESTIKRQMFKTNYFCLLDRHTCGNRWVRQQILPQPCLLQGQRQVNLPETMLLCSMCSTGGWSTTPSMAWTMTPPWSLLHGLAGCTTRQTKPPWKRWQFLDNLLWGDKKSRLCTYCKWYLRLLLTTLGCQNILRTPPAPLRDVTVFRGQWILTCPTPQPSPRYIPIAWNIKKDFTKPSFARLKLGFLPKTTRAEFCIVDLLNKSIVSKRT